MSAHHVRHHHVCKQSVADNGDLFRLRDLGIRSAAEVIHDFARASWLLRGVSKHSDSGILLQEFSILKARIRTSARGVRDDQEFGARVGLSQFLEFGLVGWENIILMWDGETVVLVEYDGPDIRFLVVGFARSECLREWHRDLVEG